MLQSGDPSGAPASNHDTVETSVALAQGEATHSRSPVDLRLLILIAAVAAGLLVVVLPMAAAAIAAAAALAGATAVLVRRSVIGPAGTRGTFTLLSVALAIQTIGVLLAAASTIATSVAGSLSLSVETVAYVASAPFFLAAIIGMPHTPDRRRRLRAVADTSVAALAFGLVVWQSLLPRVGGPEGTVAGASLALSVVTAVIATSVVWMLTHGGDESGIASPVVWWWSVAGFAGVLAAVAGGATGEVTSRTSLLLLVVSAAAYAVAGYLDPRCQADLTPREIVTRQRVVVLAPLLPLVIAASVLLMMTMQGRSLPSTSVGLGVALLIALVASTLLARLDSLEVTHNLEDRVAERTLVLGSRERWFSALVQNSSDVITVVGIDGTIRFQTASATRVLGHDPNRLVDQKLSGLLRPDDAERLLATLRQASASPNVPISLELPIWHREGRWCDTETTVTSLLHDPRIRGIVLNTRDVSERRRLEEALTRQAFSDALTGLANRALFRDSVEEALAEGAVGTVAVVFMDLNGFKAVNDSQGHAVGDQLLEIVGQRLLNCVRPGDVVARLGGDEFAVLVTGERAEAGAVWVADRVRRVLAADFVLGGRSVMLGAALGIAVNDDGDETADRLLRNADLAMYRAKAAQRTEFLRFEASMHDDLVARVDAEKDLRDAVDRGELRLHFQPLVDLRTGDVVGAEALTRWYHPTRGLIGPSEFIELAEETGIVDRIGAWALDEAAKAAATWQHYAPEGLPFRVSVNVSARQVASALPRTVRDALAHHGLPANALTLEMTESVLMERPEDAAAILSRLKSLGVRIAIDDFGTGYSSLSYLSRFPVDVLKIDQSFVEHVHQDSEQSELVRTIIHLGRSLNLVTVAEGIETEAQRDAIMAMGCTLGQGYLFARALPVDEMTRFLAKASYAHA